MKVNPQDLRSLSELTDVLACAITKIVDLCDEEIDKAHGIIDTERGKEYPAEWRIESARQYVAVYEKIKYDVESREVDISDILFW